MSEKLSETILVSANVAKNRHNPKTNSEINQANTRASQSLTDLQKDFEIASAVKSKEHERAMKQLDLELQNTLTPVNLKHRKFFLLLFFPSSKIGNQMFYFFLK